MVSGLMPQMKRAVDAGETRPSFLAQQHARGSMVLGLIPCCLLVLLVLPTLGLKSLWLDEAYVADIIVRRAFDPLALSTTPLGFSVAIMAVVHVAGTTEFWFRFLPFLFSLGAVALTFLWARDLSASIYSGLLPAVLVASNLCVTTYAKTLKPYSADMFFCVLAILLAKHVRRHASPLNWTLYMAVLVVGPFFSFPFVFVAILCAISLLPSVWSGDRPRARAWLVAHAVPGLVFLPYALLFLRFQHSSGGLLSYWDSAFPPHSGLSTVALWYARQTGALLAYLFAPFYIFLPGGVGYAVAVVVAALSMGLIMIGARVIARASGADLMLTVGPVALVAVAALVHVYPYGGSRLLLFTLPGLTILLAAGLSCVARALLHAAPVPAARVIVPLGVIGFTIVVAAYVNFAQPYSSINGDATEETRSLVVNDLWPGVRPGDVVYVYYGSSDAVQYYTPAYRSIPLTWGDYRAIRRRGVVVVFGGIHRGDPRQYGVEIAHVIRSYVHQRLWLIFSHVFVLAGPTRSEEQVLMSDSARCGTIGSTDSADNATLYLVTVAHPTSCASGGGPFHA